MTLKEIAFLFDRAVSHLFIKAKCLLTFSVLALIGLCIVFFHAIVIGSGIWTQLSALFISIFFSIALIMPLGIFLIRVYHDEVKQRVSSYREISAKSWSTFIGSSYFVFPLVLSYIALWAVLGFLLLLGEAPGWGGFKVVFSFLPFIINLGCLLLCFLGILGLYLLAPLIAFKGADYSLIYPILLVRLKNDIFFNGLLLVVASIPFVLSLLFIVLALGMTDSLYFFNQTALQNVFSWFFIMLPIAAVLTPSLVFFFNFAAEAHVWMQKSHRDRAEHTSE